MGFQTTKTVRYSEEDLKKIAEYDEVSGYNNIEDYDDNRLISCAKAELKKLNNEIKILHKRGIETPELNDMWQNMTLFLGLKLADKIVDDMSQNGEKVNSLGFAINTFMEIAYNELKALSPKEK